MDYLYSFFVRHSKDLKLLNFRYRTYATGTTQVGDRIGKAALGGTIGGFELHGSLYRRGKRDCWAKHEKRCWLLNSPGEKALGDRPLAFVLRTIRRAILALAFNYPLPARRVRGRIDNQNILIIAPMRSTKLNYCQYLLSSHINYTLTN
jgi:hypothetical protein